MKQDLFEIVNSHSDRSRMKAQKYVLVDQLFNKPIPITLEPIKVEVQQPETSVFKIVAIQLITNLLALVIVAALLIAAFKIRDFLHY